MHQETGTPTTVLVVDDSIETIQIVKFALQRGNFHVMTALSGSEALELMSYHGLPHLIILDLHMPPGMDGFEFCRIVNRWCDVPIIMLTAVDESDTVVEGLELHVEDYVVKPFMPEELMARVKRVLGRIGVFPFMPTTPLQIDDHLSIDFPGRMLYFDGREISITPTETKLLYLLLRRPEETISYEYLLQRMWPREMVFEDRLHVFVHRLRHKLARHQITHSYVSLDRSIGYRFSPLLEAMIVA